MFLQSAFFKFFSHCSVFINRSVLISVAVSCLLAAAVSFVLYVQRQEKEYERLNSYIQSARQIERAYIEKLPIYEDYMDSKKENALRKYLMNYHLGAVLSRKTVPLSNSQEISGRLAKGTLVDLREDPDIKETCFFYNVPSQFRFLTPYSKSALLELGKKFRQLLQEKGVHSKVLFAVSSVLRPQNYQNQLGSRNANAALISSHSYGESFDVFLDEFYVLLDPLDPIEPIAPLASLDANANADAGARAAFGQMLRRKIGFLMGQALRRQFQSVLTEAVLQLQDEKKIYAVWEKKQRCYHITAR